MSHKKDMNEAAEPQSGPEKLIAAIEADIQGRAGLGDLWKQMDPDTREGVKSRWLEIARECK